MGVAVETLPDLRVARCNNLSCTSATVATLDSLGDVGRGANHAIGADGLGLIAYWDTTNNAVKVAHCSNAQCLPFVRRR